MELHIDGRRAFAASYGRRPDPARPTVMFVHGAAMDRTVWTLFGRYFTRQEYNAIAVDLPGHGRSEGPALESISAMADWIATLLAAMEIDAAYLVGHSMGSLAVLDAAARHRERVRGIALIGTSAPMRVTDALLDPARANEHLALDLVTLWGHSPRAQVGGFSIPGICMTTGGLRLLERAAPGVLFADLNACNEYAEGIERAREVRCPVLLVLGERDSMTPAPAARELEGALKAPRRLVIRQGGHQLMSERPNQVLDALVEFVG
ncbi:MAG: alpha/beta hydrolase [Immundisolibacterales bacterium]|nr:alpha/beta hydrolase [Immundisolibacterales bacterium]